MDLTIPHAFRPSLRVGTCSWKYDTWKGILYNRDRSYRPFDYLPDYAMHLRTVEVDQWFWCLFPGGLRLPDPETVRCYRDSVPDDFVFTVKAPNALTLTHFYAKQPRQHVEFGGRPNAYFFDPDLLARFLDRLAPLQPRIGSVMFQFEYLNRQKMPSLAAFLDRFDRFIRSAPKEFRYAVEIRNPGYLRPSLFERLEALGVGYVFIEGYHMPPITEVFDRYPPASSGHVVIRLVGPDRAGIEHHTGGRWDRVVAPKSAGLVDAARITRACLERRVATYVNVNNHYEGCAPRTIARFLRALGGRPLSDGDDAGIERQHNGSADNARPTENASPQLELGLERPNVVDDEGGER